MLQMSVRFIIFFQMVGSYLAHVVRVCMIVVCVYVLKNIMKRSKDLPFIYQKKFSDVSKLLIYVFTVKIIFSSSLNAL